MALFDLSDDLLINLIAKWLDKGCLARFDGAVCNQTVRSILLQFYSNPTVVFDGLANFDTHTHNYYFWTNSRNILLRWILFTSDHFDKSRLNCQMDFSKVSNICFANCTDNVHSVGMEIVISKCTNLRSLVVENVDCFDDPLIQSNDLLKIFRNLTSINFDCDCFSHQSLTYLVNNCHQLISLKLTMFVPNLDSFQPAFSALIENNSQHLKTLFMLLKDISCLNKLIKSAAKCSKLTDITLHSFDDLPNVEEINMAVLTELFRNFRTLLNVTIINKMFFLKYEKYSEYWKDKLYICPNTAKLTLSSFHNHVLTGNVRQLFEHAWGVKHLSLDGFDMSDEGFWYHLHQQNSMMETLTIGNSGQTLTYHQLKTFLDSAYIWHLTLEYCSHISNEELLNALDRNAPNLYAVAEAKTLSTEAVATELSCEDGPPKSEQIRSESSEQDQDNETDDDEDDENVQRHPFVTLTIRHHNTLDTATLISIYNMQRLRDITLKDCPAVDEVMFRAVLKSSYWKTAFVIET